MRNPPVSRRAHSSRHLARLSALFALLLPGGCVGPPRLLETGEAYLEEGNDCGDRVWGVYQGQGENRLGKILMKVRAELRSTP
ncbi:hypothetical protein RAS1_29490 [Phycisphaerae bacterium RAS1]|nr:hypothetical protein RAS1_29490 [Phycisphaerae bacterium RAS1]